MLIDVSNDLSLHLSSEHHLDHLHHFRCGDAQTAAELGFDAELFEHRIDLRPSSVDDDRTQACEAQEDDILGERGRQVRVDHRVAAEFHHHRCPMESPQPGQGTGENRCLVLGVVD